MGAGKPRARAGRGSVVSVGAASVVIGVAALAGGCASAPSALALAAGQSPGRALPTVTPASVPALGGLTYGTFPATNDGLRALTLCEQWAGLRAEYVARIPADTPYQREQWFSGREWEAAFSADSPLKTDPAYTGISTAFGLASAGDAASIASARLLDKACAAAD